jgi:hypothetical protein
MANDMAGKPQTEKKHPDEWERDLNPNRMGGQNIGGESEARESQARSAFDVKPVHRAFQDFSDDELKQIPVLENGTRLRQGATYLDLARGRFVAGGDMEVGRDQLVVPKDRVHYETWNKLVGEEKG